jgi:hypothetical protein
VQFSEKTELKLSLSRKKMRRRRKKMTAATTRTTLTVNCSNYKTSRDT